MKHIVVLCLVVLFVSACHKGKMKRNACSYPVSQDMLGDGYISVPNIFTPDGDGRFDTWRIQHDGLIEYHIRVEDRLGREAWVSHDPDEVWEALNPKGKELEGLFYYHVVARSESGQRFDADSYVAVIRDPEKLCPKNLDDCVFKAFRNNGSLEETSNSKEYKASYPCR